MPATASLLRYPGGKSQLYNYVKHLIDYNFLTNCTYVEPFAGGAGLALKLLFNNNVSQIVINDFDPAIYAMWYSCIHYPTELKKLVQQAPLTIQEWNRQQAIYQETDTSSILDLGFSTLYLNRTNRSGIISGGVLGGKDQSGKYKIGARYNRETLCHKIDQISSHSDRITVLNQDAKVLLADNHFCERNCFLNIDPPYVEKGSQLYRNNFSIQDHIDFAAIVAECSMPWIVTYDICSLVQHCYRRFRHSKLNIKYSANIKRNANEYIFFSDNLCIPPDIHLITADDL